MTTADSYCFCELAPLYVLDMLTEAERLWVEEQIQACPELAAELTDYEVAATAIPYSVTPEPLPSPLKTQLFDRLNLALPDVTPEIQPSLPEFLIVRSQDLRWRSQGIPGITVAMLHMDRDLRQIVGLLRAEPGAYYPYHRHAGVEEIYMLSGDLVMGDQVYGVGDYIRSYPGSTHTTHSPSGCMFFFRTSMDDDYSEAELTSVV